MNILETTHQIITKHNLAKKLTFNPFKLRRESKAGGCGWSGEGVLGFSDSPEFKDSYEKTTSLMIKYDSRVPDGWYGFDTSCWPINWLNALEEFLAELEKDSPDFEIHTIKLKWGGARIGLGNESIDAQRAIDLLEDVMRDENLIY
jgi:hypothetical protein